MRFYQNLKNTVNVIKAMFVPSKIFFTKGVGVHKDRLASFELSLRKAGIEKCNLVYVSSIFPPNCRQISRTEGLKQLQPGGITYCVMARNDTNEPNRLVSSAIGLALPSVSEEYGYLSEHHAYGETEKKTGEYAEDLAATMLATTLGIEFDVNAAWSEREQTYKASGKIIKTKNTCQSAEGDKNGLWTTTIAVAVFL
jgi:arginine decarboxylase